MGLARWVNNRLSADSRLADERMKKRMDRDRAKYNEAISNEKDESKKKQLEKGKGKHTAGGWKNFWGVGRAMTKYNDIYKKEKQAIKDKRKREEMGINRWNAFTSSFKKPKDLSGLKGKELKAAKEHNERLRLAKAYNKDTIGKAKGVAGKVGKHLSKHKGKYIAAGVGLAALGAASGFVGRNYAHQRKMAKMAYADRRDRRSALVGAVGAAALGVGRGMQSNQPSGQQSSGGGGYHPALNVGGQQQQGKGKGKLLGAAMNLASKNPQLSQMLLSGAARAIGG